MTLFWLTPTRLARQQSQSLGSHVRTTRWFPLTNQLFWSISPSQCCVSIWDRSPPLYLPMSTKQSLDRQESHDLFLKNCQWTRNVQRWRGLHATLWYQTLRLLTLNSAHMKMKAESTNKKVHCKLHDLVYQLMCSTSWCIHVHSVFLNLFGYEKLPFFTLHPVLDA